MRLFIKLKLNIILNTFVNYFDCLRPMILSCNLIRAKTKHSYYPNNGPSLLTYVANSMIEQAMPMFGSNLCLVLR